MSDSAICGCAMLLEIYVLYFIKCKDSVAQIVMTILYIAFKFSWTILLLHDQHRWWSIVK